MAMKTISTSRILIMAAAGAIAGFLTFVLLDPSLREQEMASHAGNIADIQDRLGQAVMHAVMLGCLLGAAIGGALILTEEAATGRVGRTVGRVLLGLVVGTVCGGAGGIGGQILFSILLVPLAVAGQAGTPFLIIARTAGWSLVGAAAGICPGVVARSPIRVRQGAIGGLLGGAAGGLLFDAIAAITQGGSISRAVGFTLIGLAVGALVGLIEEAGKQHWLTMLSGAREGRTIILAKAATTLGRNEMADVPLFGDPSVQQAHAVLLLNGNEATLQALAPAVTVNDQPAAVARLSDGDIVAIGRHRLRFSSRHTSSPIPVAPRDMAGRPLPSLADGSPASGYPSYSAGSQVPDYPPLAGGGSTPGYPPQAGPYAPGFAPTNMALTGASGVTAVSGPHAGAFFRLFDGAIAGRDPRCDIALVADTQASRQHARFLQDGGGWRIEDGGSTNGTYVNGQRVAVCPLQPGDQITIGGTVLRVG